MLSVDDLINSIANFFQALSAFELTCFVFSVFGVIELLTFSLVVLYTFFNVARHPDSSTSFLRVLLAVIFYLTFRSVFVPFLFAGLIVKTSFVKEYMPLITKISVIIMGCWYNLTITLPCFTTIYSRWYYGVGNAMLTPSQTKFDFVVLLPVYNETYELLVEGIQSIIQQNYPQDKITLHVSFDSPERSTLYLQLLDYFDLHAGDVPYTSYSRFINYDNTETVYGIYQGVRVYIHKFPHGGKRLTQAKTFAVIKQHTHLDFKKTIVIFTDSDNYTYNNAFHNLASTFDRFPNKMALAGFMTCMSSGKNRWNLWNLIQDVEYCSGETNRSFELLMGTVNCLPGGFTALRFEIFSNHFFLNDKTIMDKYFGTLPSKTLTDFHRNYLGEDRYLTHLFHQTLPRYSLGFSPAARSKTDPPGSFMGLVRQRRRWLLGGLSNEAYMITDIIIAHKFTFLVVFKTIQLAFKCNFFSQVVMTMFAVSSVGNNDMGSILMLSITAGVPLLMNWLAACFTAHKLGHYKVIVLQPLMLVICSFVQVFIDFYTMFTFRTRTWGGPRMNNNNTSGGTLQPWTQPPQVHTESAMYPTDVCCNEPPVTLYLPLPRFTPLPPITIQ